LKASSKMNIVGALIAIVMVILLLVPQPAHAEQVNGEYTIGFNIMHADKKNASIAEGYWNQPAKVFIKDGHIRIHTTINKHAWVTKFAISYNGSMNEAKTISVDEAANTRVTEFQVANFTDLVESNVSVYIEEIDYDHSYTMYFKFKPETLTLVKAEETQAPAATQAPAVTEQVQAATPTPAREVMPAEQSELQKASPTPAPSSTAAAAAEDSSQDSTLEGEQSTNDLESAGAGEGTTETLGEAVPDGQPETERSDADQQEKEASEMVESTETAGATNLPTAETEALEEGSSNGNLVIIIAIIIVLIAILAVIVYRTRHNKK